jgi:small-conductance mechanosensitive channel
VLLAAARAHPKTLVEPAPVVFFSGFGDNGLHFELGVWTLEMARSPRRFRSELTFAIERAFREHGIALPPPLVALHAARPRSRAA